MAQWVWALVAVVGIVLLVAIVLLVNRQRRTIGLQQRFGPEYDRTIRSAEGRRAAEAALEERARRRSELDIVPLEEPVRVRYSEEWRALQEHFVDRPSETVGDAEALLMQVMGDRGYPVGDFGGQVDVLSVDYPDVVDNYRVAHGIHQRNQANEATTEELREAMLRYRSLFDDLLGPDQRATDQRATDQHATPNGTERSDGDLRREHR